MQQFNKFIYNLQQLLHNNVSLPESLGIMLRVTKHKKSKVLIQQILYAINNGTAFSTALRSAYPNINNITYQWLELAEKNRQLPAILQHIYNSNMALYELRKNLLTSLYYPATLLGTGTMLIIGFITCIAPIFIELYQNANHTLPFILKLAQHCNYYLTHPQNIILITCWILLLIKLIWKHLNIINILVKIPKIKTYIYELYSFNFCYGMLVNLQANQHLTTALEHTAMLIPYQKFQHQLLRSVQVLATGTNLVDALDNCNWIDREALHIVAVAQHSANLPTAFLHCTQTLQTNLLQRYHRLAKLFEPIIVITISIILGTIILALYLPILEIANLV